MGCGPSGRSPGAEAPNASQGATGAGLEKKPTGDKPVGVVFAGRRGKLFGSFGSVISGRVAVVRTRVSVLRSNQEVAAMKVRDVMTMSVVEVSADATCQRA